MSLDFSLLAIDRDGNKIEVLSKNITHNLTAMASEAGIYEALWHPERINAKTASDILPLLEAGYWKMKDDPARFEKHNASNGWGTYEHFLPWVKEVLAGCKQYPSAEIWTSV